jgi:high-affinity Fe2+/Pb2+ permease
MTAIGAVAFCIGMSCAWLDIASNGATNAQWAGLMLSLATLGAVLMGVEYLRT